MSREYRPDIDGLRAIAVLSVVVFHAFPASLRGGFVGVDVFFVISGFLISGIIFKNLDRGSFSYADFYARRIRRIFPSLSIVLLACLLIGSAMLLPDELEKLGRHVAAGAASASNLQLLFESGYFDAASERKPLLHLWSLGIEEQFYLVWPACLALLWKRRRGVVFGAITVLALLSFTANVVRVHAHSISTFYLPVTRFWELLIGGLLAHATVVGKKELPVSLRGAASLVGFAMIVVAVASAGRGHSFPGWLALLPTLGTALVIAAGPEALVNRIVLSRRAMVFIGLISYPLYLWHWPLLAFARIVDSNSVAARCTLVALSFVLAWMTWRLLELRLRTARGTTHVRTLALAMGALLLLGLGALFGKGFAGRLTLEGRALAADVGGSETRPPTGKCPEGQENLSICLQSRPGRANAVVIGDSHAGSVFSGLALEDPRRNWLVLGNNSCPPTLGIKVTSDAQGCEQKMQQIFDYVVAAPEIETAVLGFYGYYGEHDDVAADHLANAKGPSHMQLAGESADGTKQGVLLTGLGRAIQELIDHGKRVLLVVDVPELPFFPRDCVPRPLVAMSRECAVDREAVDRRQTGLRRVVATLRSRFPALGIFDPLSAICDATTCRPVRDGVSLYCDSHHLSVRGSQLVAHGLIAMIEAAPY